MVINSTNINKKEQSPLILTELTEHNKTMTYDIDKNGVSLDVSISP